MRKLDSKEAVEKATIAILMDWKPFLNSITADNGKEFAHHQAISEALEIDFFSPALIILGNEAQMKI